jgi:ribosomal protein L37E
MKKQIRLFVNGEEYDLQLEPNRRFCKPCGMRSASPEPRKVAASGFAAAARIRDGQNNPRRNNLPLNKQGSTVSDLSRAYSGLWASLTTGVRV